MRVCPVNIVKTSNYINQKVSKTPSFKSQVPIPTSPYELMAGCAFFAAVVAGIYYMGFKIIDKFEEMEEQMKEEMKQQENVAKQ